MSEVKKENEPIRFDDVLTSGWKRSDPGETAKSAPEWASKLDLPDTIRVGNSRVSLDVIVEQYENGMTPEDMVRAYDTLSLEEVRETIAYYLSHRNEVRGYLERRKEQVEALRAKIEAKHHPISRLELLARIHARTATTLPDVVIE